VSSDGLFAAYLDNESNVAVNLLTDQSLSQAWDSSVPYPLSSFASDLSYSYKFRLSSRSDKYLRIAAVDGTDDPDYKGRVAVFWLDDGTGGVPFWDIAGSAIVGDPGEGFGYSLSISDDGKVLAVGSDVPDLVEASNNNYGAGNSPEGFVRVFTHTNLGPNTWTQLGDKIEATSAGRNLDSCSISGDRFSVAVFDQSAGFTQVYKTNTLDASSGAAQWTLVGDPVETYGEPVLSYDGTVMATGNAVLSSPVTPGGDRFCTRTECLATLPSLRTALASQSQAIRLTQKCTSFSGTREASNGSYSTELTQTSLFTRSSHRIYLV